MLVEARQRGVAFPAEVIAALEISRHAPLTLAVVGIYQAGKSTLINRAFLDGQVLLVEGQGLPTTAVVTEIRHGTTPRLTIQVWPAPGATADSALPPVRVINQPTEQDLRVCTTGRTPAERLRLAETTAQVTLDWPAPALDGYVLLDTPGIDDPCPELLAATTGRVIPQADAAILVVPPRQLSTPELEFLRSGLFAVGLNRLMVLVSYNPATSPHSAESRSKLLAVIRAQLDQMGRGHIPVDIFCHDPSVTGPILNTPESIRGRILSFAWLNAAHGRRERLTRLFYAAFSAARADLQLRLAVIHAGQEKCAAALQELKIQDAAVRQRFADLRRDALAGHDAIWNNLANGIRADLDTLKSRFLDRLGRTENLREAQKQMNELSTFFKDGIESILKERLLAAREQAAALAATANVKLDEIRPLLPATMAIDAGLFASVPPLLVTVLDYGLFVALPIIPPISVSFVFLMHLAGVPAMLIAGAKAIGLAKASLPLLFANSALELALRKVLGFLPVIKKLLPSGLVRQQLVDTATEALDDGIQRLGLDLTASLRRNCLESRERLDTDLRQTYEEELARIRQAFSFPQPSTTPGEETGTLAGQITFIDQTLARLQPEHP